MSGCLSKYKLLVPSTKNFHANCDDTQTIVDVSVADCNMVACNFSADAFHFLNDVCEILLCRIPRVADLNLTPVPVGWDIYVKSGMESVTSTTWQTVTCMTQQTAPATAADSVEEELALPVWAIAVIVVVGVLAVAGIGVAVVCCKRPRWRRQQPKPEVRTHTYINQNQGHGTGFDTANDAERNERQYERLAMNEHSQS